MMLPAEVEIIRADAWLAADVATNRCSHHAATSRSAPTRPDHVRLSDIESTLTCNACGKRGAEVRPNYPKARMGPVKWLDHHLVNQSMPALIADELGEIVHRLLRGRRTCRWR